MADRPQVAFYAPMKAPTHPNPSGDRQIARLTLRALDRAGFAPVTVSELRILDLEGDPALQAQLRSEAEVEAARLLDMLATAPPTLWFTYHCHYKTPDLIGPVVTQALGIPYVISEPSISPRRRQGLWARFAELSDAAIARADHLFWSTERDRPALAAAGHAARMTELPPFVDPGPAPVPRDAGAPLRLLTVAMMRPGDKLESYRRLAAALGRLPGDWRLIVIGHGPAEGDVMALLAPLGDRITRVRDVTDPAALRPHYEAADLLVWPGVNEGVGMAWLEAQAAGLPIVAEDGPAVRAIAAGGRLAAPNDPAAFADAIRDAAAARRELSAAARSAIEARHNLDAAAATLGGVLRGLVQ